MRGLSGTWHNQHGSRMELRVADDGKLTGAFVSGVGLAREGEQFDLVGFARGELIAFVVDFSRYDSVTTWSGHYLEQDGRPVIQAMWQMTVAAPRKALPGAVWKGIWTGADVFQREPAERGLPGRVPSHPVAWQEAEEVLRSLSAPSSGDH